MDRYARLRPLLFGFILLGACSPRLVLVKPGGTDAELAQDRYRCMQETGYAGEPNALTGLGTVFSSTAAGMQGGYNPHAAQAQALANSRQFFVACMESRGYKLQPKPLDGQEVKEQNERM